MSRPSRGAAAAAVLVLFLAASGCGGGQKDHGGSEKTVAACGPEVHESIDPRSTQHIFPGAPEPAYLTDPPTSGPHQIGNHPTGVLVDPITRPVQVSMLEGGAVLVQYDRLSDADRHRLEAVASGLVTVAPRPGLPAPVVATAWTYKLTCTRVDVAALRRFVTAHQGRGAGHP